MDPLVKSKINLRAFLIGAKYYRAARVMELCEAFHPGTRKDGKTPSFAHQIAVTQYTRTIIGSVMYPELTLATDLIHDTPEDGDMSFEEIIVMFGESAEDMEFGRRLADAARRMTKKWRGERVPDDIYYTRIAECPVASISKGSDRPHNISTMVGEIDYDTRDIDIEKPIFSWEKQHEYIEETEMLFIPAMKRARKLWPQQEPAYQNILHVTRLQISLIRAIHKALGVAKS